MLTTFHRLSRSTMEGRLVSSMNSSQLRHVIAQLLHASLKWALQSLPQLVSITGPVLQLGPSTAA